MMAALIELGSDEALLFSTLTYVGVECSHEVFSSPETGKQPVAVGSESTSRH